MVLRVKSKKEADRYARNIQKAKQTLRVLQQKEPVAWYWEKRFEKIQKKLQAHETRMNNIWAAFLKSRLVFDKKYNKKVVEKVNKKELKK